MVLTTQVTNAQFDAALALVPAPFGPLTRAGTTTDLDADPVYDPNIYQAWPTKSALGFDVAISYTDMQSAMKTNDIVRAAHGQHTVLWDMMQFVEALGNMREGLSDAELFAFSLALFRKMMLAFAAIPNLGAMIPFDRFHEVEGVKFMTAAIALTDAGGQIANIADTSTNTEYATWGILIMGDGNFYELADIPATHDYVGAATYTATLILINHTQGVVFAQDTVVIA